MFSQLKPTTFEILYSFRTHSTLRVTVASESQSNSENYTGLIDIRHVAISRVDEVLETLDGDSFPPVFDLSSGFTPDRRRIWLGLTHPLR